MTVLTNILKFIAASDAGVKSYGVFISHAWTFHADYLKLIELLYSIKDFRWHNTARYQYDTIPADDVDLFHDYLPGLLKEQIQNAHCILLLADLFRENKYWPQKEADIGRELGKPIIAIQSRWFYSIPRQIFKEANEIVEWNPDIIASAIKRHCKL
ncbi:MAG: hypothetical protein A2W19_03875 [Spirochaetes bacterium RBG_16_49_21]|nr:MAG: hypothetical protein A2W19_03875 [Spirochaetes bacterium RBG_16_49_21]